MNLLRSRWSTWCAAACLGSPFVFPAAVRAQDAAAQPATWGFMAGGEGVTGAYRGTLSSGATLGLEAQFPLAARRLAVRADVLYHFISDYHYGCSPTSIDCGFRSEGVGHSLFSGALGLVARLNDPATRWSPYVIGGVAAYVMGDSYGPFIDMRSNHLGFQGGMGFEVRPRDHTYFVEMRYLGIPPGGIVPVTIGMRF